MTVLRALMSVCMMLPATFVQADESTVILGRSAFAAHCALCHGPGGKGDGEIAELFQVPPSDLTKLAERSGGTFPFPMVYNTILNGMEKRGHGDSTMPIWGDFFIADALMDRGVSQTDAMYIAAGRALSVVYYLESVQE